MAHRICALSRGPVRHADAMTRVFTQIDKPASYGVCAITPAGAIPFPPRNEGLDFMNQLDAGTGTTEAQRVIVVREQRGTRGVDPRISALSPQRLRPRRRDERVFQQILGQGIQPVCR